MRHPRFLLVPALLLALPGCSKSDSPAGAAGTPATRDGSSVDAHAPRQGAGGADGSLLDAAGADGASTCAPVATPEEAVRVYGGAWNETDPARRLCALRRSMADDATYVDPTTDTVTSADLATAIAGFQATFTTATIVQRSGLDVQNGQLRFAWDMLSGGVSSIQGEDFMELAADGRIQSVRGYWEPIATSAPTGALAAYVAAWTAADASARDASLAAAVTSTVQFTAPGVKATGPSALSTFIAGAGVTSVQALGKQVYPKYARLVLRVTLGDGGTKDVTDYAHLDGAGLITRLARFEGEFPPL